MISTVGEASSLLKDMLAAYNQIQGVVETSAAHRTQQLEAATRRTHRAIQEGLEQGSRSVATVGLAGLIAECHTLREGEEYGVAERLEPYLGALRQLIQRAATALQLDECPLPDPDNYQSPASKKRRLAMVESVSNSMSLAEGTRAAVLQSLRNPANNRQPSALTAAEHKLLCTVVTESALLPDIAAMHDLYHPVVCLYNVDGDRQWTAPPGVHLGFYATTMLHEFVIHRGGMRRFTFAHVMQRMGFGAADINFYATYVDDTFYRRIVCDTRVGFLADAFSPRVRLYRSQHWAQLWDCFLAHRNRTDGTPWTRLTRASVAADGILQDAATADPQQLLPTTVLAALHRHHGTQVVPYDEWVVMEHLVELEAEFVSGLAALRQGALVTVLEACRTHVRAWPVCLRSAAVNHVRLLTQSLSLLPRSPQVVACALNREEADARACRDWLWALAPRRTDGDDEREPWTSSPGLLEERLRQHMIAPTTPPSLMQQCEELDEEALCGAAVARYGAVTDEHRNKMTHHLENLATLVQAAAGTSPALWSERRRRAYGYRPSEVFAAIRQEADLLTPEEHEAALAHRLQVIVDDPVAADLGGESVTGDSQLRPRTLYPAPC